MKLINLLKKIVNFFSVIVFFAMFFLLIFDAVSSQEGQQNFFRVKSHLKFDKKFSGNTFVIDGDSLKVGGKEVRLFGLDAPEYSQKCLDQKEKEYECGKISQQFLINLAGGKQVVCYYAERDKYNRYLGKCFVDKISINEEIVKNGMAVIYNFTESDPKMDKLESLAKEKKLGIWKGPFELPKNYRKKNPRH
jgi:endonuclease YncB( thermonuclease family)